MEDPTENSAMLKELIGAILVGSVISKYRRKHGMDANAPVAGRRVTMRESDQRLNAAIDELQQSVLGRKPKE